MPRYIVTLTNDERKELETLIQEKGRLPYQTYTNSFEARPRTGK